MITVVLAQATKAQAQVSSVAITELLASNQSGVLDEDGDRSDWIEIANPTDQTVSLDGWFLSDDPSNPMKWAFPTGEIAAGEYVIVFASGKDRGPVGGEWHTNFRLSTSGESVVFTNAQLSVVQRFDFGAQFDDVSVGPDAGGGVNYFDPPTPGALNGDPLVGFALREPILSPPRGLLLGPVQVSMSTQEPGATVRYTIDGSRPSADSPVAVGPLPIDTTTTIRAASFTPDGMSNAITSSYVMLDEVVDQADMDPQVTQGAQYGGRMIGSLQSVPSIYLTMENLTGEPIDASYEQVSMEWIDGAETFQIDAGIKIYGNKSLLDAKKNYRLKFSDEFGPSRLNFDFYSDFDVASSLGILPTDSFDKLELRGGSGDSNLREIDRNNALRLRTAMADDAMLEMGIPNPHNRYIHVYLNGNYRGAYDLRERFDTDFMASYFGGADDDYDFINKNAAVQGTVDAWNAIRENPTWQFLNDRVDMDGFIDFMLFNYWNGTADWTQDRNWVSAGPNSYPSDVSWVMNNKDPDNGMGRRNPVTYNMLSQPGPGGVFGSLVSEGHPEFIDALAAGIERNLTGDGALTPPRARARLDYRAAQMAAPLVADSARWGTCGELCSSRTSPLWDPDDEWTTHLEYQRNEWIPQRTAIVLDQVQSAGWLPVASPELDGCCVVSNGAAITIRTTDGAGSIFYTTTGVDPRLVGGAISPSALEVSDATEAVVVISGPTRLTARVKRGDEWSAARTWDVTVEGTTTPLILNEWNAVSNTQMLARGDVTLGQVPGNGGDWFELVVIQDHLDVRNWQLDISTGGVPRDALTFGAAPVLSDLRSGTIITVSESQPEDLGYDPSGGDWHINLRAADDGTGQFITAENFVVNSDDWELSIRDSAGVLRSGPAGESVGSQVGVSDNEIGELEAHPSGDIDLAADYGDGTGSTFGLANEFTGIVQDFSGLRSVVAPRGDVDCDGLTSVVDSLLIAQYAVGNRTNSECPFADPASQINAGNGDVNNDSAVNVVDALMNLRCVVGAEAAWCAP